MSPLSDTHKADAQCCQDSGHSSFSASSYEVAMRAAGTGMWDLDVETDRLMICANMARLLGLPFHPQELSGCEWRAKIFADDLHPVEKIVEQACATGQPFSLEYRIQREPGSVVWLQSRGHVLRDSHENFAHITGVSFDITDRKIAENAMRESESRFRLLADASPDGIFVSIAGKCVYANRAAASMLGATDPREIYNYTAEDFIALEILLSVGQSAKSQLESSHTTKPFTIPFHRLDGSEAIAEVTYGRVMWNGEKAIQMLCRDVTEQKQAERSMRVMNERLKLAVEGSGEGIWDRDLMTGRFELSGGVRGILGYPEHEMPKLSEEWIKLIHPDDQPAVQSALQACANGETPNFRAEYRIRAYNGPWRWLSSRGVVVARNEQGVPTAMTGTITDITAKRESEEVVWRHANLDPLTGLPNRRHFIDNLDTELRKTPRSGTITALLFIDLDGFKQVNDLFGHEAGDLLLMETSYRIQQAIRQSDCVARLGGDEFTVLLKDLRDSDHIEFVCQDILSRLSMPFSVRGEYAYISASIGVAMSPFDAQTADELLRKADTAMYGAKSAGRNQFSYFAQSMDDRAHMRLRVSTELRRAISNRQLSLRYQPVIDLQSGRVCKTEALLRWEHPKLGTVSPAVFIPIAEEAGLMSEIGNWVFHEAAASTKRWNEQTGMRLKVAINKSPVQFNRRNMESHWLQYLRELDLPPSSIVVEITEGLLLNASDDVNGKLLEYRDAGIQVAIDDFGTGYSSMAYLQKFDIDYLKIDQSFVRGIPNDPGNCTIAETIIVMAHKLGQKVIAEGIETKEQADFLIRAGCDFGQGFYFSPPLGSDNVPEVLRRRFL